MEHRYRLEQPASREQIVAIIRQRAERNRERGGGGGAPVGGGNPGDREVEARIDRRNAAIERRRFQAGRDLIAAMEPPNDPPPMMGPMGPMFGGGANGIDLMAPPPPANVRLERLRGMQGRREEALRGGLEVAGDLAAIGNLIRQASIAKEEDAPRSRHLSVQDNVLSFQPEVALAEASVNGIYVSGKVLSPEANYFEVDILDKGSSHLTFSIGVVSRLFSLDSLPGRVNDSLAFCPGDGFLFRGKDVGSPFGSRAEVGDKIGCGLRFSLSPQDPKMAGASPSSAAVASAGHLFFTLNSKEFGVVPINIPPGGFFPAISISSPGESLALRTNLRFIKEEDIMMMVDNCDDDWSCHDISLNGPVLEYIGKGKSLVDVGLAQAKHAISTRHHYFEIEIIDPGLRCYIAIGLARKDYPKNRHPGWNRGSIAYHADDGKVFVGSGVGAPFGPRCCKGDIMGCGVLFPRNYEYRSDSDDDIDAASSASAAGAAAAEPGSHPGAGRNLPQNPFAGRAGVGQVGGGDLGENDLGGVYYSSDSAADDEDWWSDRNYLPYGAKVHIYFTRNGNIIGKREVRIPKGGFFPTVGMMSSEEKVRVDLRPLSG